MPLYVPRSGVTTLATIATVVTVSTVSTATLLLTAKVQPNSVVAGSTFRCTIDGQSTSNGTLIFRIYTGTTGTVASDTVAWTGTTSVAQAANQHAGFTGQVVVRTLGSPGTGFASALGYAGTAVLPTVVAATVNASITTTAAWFITLAVTTSVASYQALTGSIEQMS